MESVNLEKYSASEARKFMDLALNELRIRNISDVNYPIKRDVLPIEPIILNDYKKITANEKDRVCIDYNSERGVAYFICLNPDDKSTKHPLHVISEQLKVELDLHFSLEHPMGNHQETIKRFGKDGTLKIYDNRKPVESGKYIEQGETSDFFDVHTDGLGSAGTVRTSILYMDSPPMFGGFTFFINLVYLSLYLGSTDWEAYTSLFQHDAITVQRPRGKGAIKVTGPVLYVDQNQLPRVFFRKSSGEYLINWKQNKELLRAKDFLHEYTEPFCPGSYFVHLANKGEGVLIRNRDIVHGRTAFIDGNNEDKKRVLARKWYMEKGHGKYKHVPGLLVNSQFAEYFPDQFGNSVLDGEWLYDKQKDINVRIK